MNKKISALMKIVWGVFVIMFGTFLLENGRWMRNNVLDFPGVPHLTKAQVGLMIMIGVFAVIYGLIKLFGKK